MIENNSIEISTTAVALHEISSQPTTIFIHNEDNTDDVYIGDENVTASNGLHLKKEETITIEVPPGDQIFVIATKAGHTVNFLRTTP